MKRYSVIGKDLPRKEGPIKAGGKARFTSDMGLPGMLVGKILRSPIPHGIIRHLDTSRAERLTGVKAVVTGKELGGRKIGRLLHRPDLWDESPLASDKVRFCGEAVAALAAADPDLAEEAMELIEVEYEELPAVFDPEAAWQPGAPEIHQGKENNLAHKVVLEFGSIDEGLKLADMVFEDEYRTQCVPVSPLEQTIAIADYDIAGNLILYSSNQSPFILRRWLAMLLDFPQDRIRVIKPFMGGGFGARREVMASDCCAALLAMKSARPVKIFYSREEEFCTARMRHPLTAFIKIGVNRDGKLIAQQLKGLLDNGAYNSSGPEILRALGGYLTALYKCPHVKYEGYLIYTNNPPNGAYRGFGNPQVRFAAESLLDKVAEELDLDPVELRLKNIHHTGDLTANKWILTSCGLEECLTEVAKLARWKEKKGRLPFGRGVGMACGNHNSGTKSYFPHDSSAAFVKLNQDGSVHLLSGAADLGQGSDSTLCQIAAEVLGIPYEMVNITSADTAITPEDMGTYASRLTYIAGNAVKIAAEDVRSQVVDAAAERLEAEPKDLELAEGKVYVTGSPDKYISLPEVARLALAKGGRHLLGRGFYDPPHTEIVNPDTGQGNYSPAYAFGAQIAEVEVDVSTGEIKVISLVAAQDCGLAINPQGLKGQIEGCIAQGLGMALSEEMIRDNGQTLNTSFLGTGIPRSPDQPEMEVTLVETIDPGGPFGAKGVSEMPLVPTAAAIANAVYDAIGIRFKQLPLTPDMVLKALEERARTQKS